MYHEKSIERISITISKMFLDEFDKLVSDLGYKSRSSAISDAMHLFFKEKRKDAPGVEIDGFVIIAYNHHQKDVVEGIIELEHHSPITIKSSMHIHVSEENCSEVIAVKGNIAAVRQFADNLQVMKGIMLCELVPLYYTDLED